MTKVAALARTWSSLSCANRTNISKTSLKRWLASLKTLLKSPATQKCQPPWQRRIHRSWPKRANLSRARWKFSSIKRRLKTCAVSWKAVTTFRRSLLLRTSKKTKKGFLNRFRTNLRVCSRFSVSKRKRFKRWTKRVSTIRKSLSWMMNSGPPRST